MRKSLAFLLVLALEFCMLPGLALAEETAPTFDLTTDLVSITIPGGLVTCGRQAYVAQWTYLGGNGGHSHYHPSATSVPR